LSTHLHSSITLAHFFHRHGKLLMQYKRFYPDCVASSGCYVEFIISLKYLSL
jgi:hypothetical protein